MVSAGAFPGHQTREPNAKRPIWKYAHESGSPASAALTGSCPITGREARSTGVGAVARDLPRLCDLVCLLCDFGCLVLAASLSTLLYVRWLVVIVVVFQRQIAMAQNIAFAWATFLPRENVAARNVFDINQIQAGMHISRHTILQKAQHDFTRLTALDRDLGRSEIEQVERRLGPHAAILPEPGASGAHGGVNRHAQANAEKARSFAPSGLQSGATGQSPGGQRLESRLSLGGGGGGAAE